jgi:hypothetical protein
LKAMLLASAPLPPEGQLPEPGHGWGTAQLDHVVGDTTHPRRSLLWDLRHAEGLQHGQSFSSSLIVTDEHEPLEITLVWTDPPGAPGVASALVNELGLKVNGPAAGTAEPVVLTDNGTVKRCLVTRPAVGLWTVTVRATAVRREDLAQGFAVVAVGAVLSS